MRERTPSADDTPKRAPPAPTREAASTDVVGSGETPNDDPAEGYRTAKLSCTTTSSDMVASTQSLDDPGVNHPANATSGDRQQQQQQERYGHAYRSAQTAQDKRSRLSNVINNLRKKVPDGAARSAVASDSPREEEDDRTSIERNLESLQKYVMTMLSNVIDDEEDKEDVVGGKNGDKTKEPSGEGDIEAAVVPQLDDATMTSSSATEKNVEFSETMDHPEIKKTTEESIEDSEIETKQESKKQLRTTKEGCIDINKKEKSLVSCDQDDRNILCEKTEPRTLDTVVIDRLSEHQADERANVDDGRGGEEHEDTVLHGICKEMLQDLVSNIDLGLKETTSQEMFKTSLHCSLPLEKVVSVLQNCQVGESLISRVALASSSSSTSNMAQSSIQKLSPSKLSSSTVPIRLLCLYCDRKFVSISLRQRHTERVHQLGGGRRSERNPRKPSQNCQYCSERCADTLEGLFQHMVNNHGDKYHACVPCSTRFPTREVLMGHTSEVHDSGQAQPDKIKEGSPCKEFCGPNLREKVNVSSVRKRRPDEGESESQGDARTKLIGTRESVDNNPASPEFDSSFYTNVSCNIRENLLHHLDGKLQTISSLSSTSASVTVANTTTTTTTTTTMTTTEPKSQQQQTQQSYYEHNQIQFPIDISLTAATPVYSKDYTAEEYENSSEYARKAGKTSSGSRPRRVSFEKYNFPRKYDGRGQDWTSSIKDLSNFDISTQLLLSKKQQLIKERLTISRVGQTSVPPANENTEVREPEQSATTVKQESTDDATSAPDAIRCDLGEPPPCEIKQETTAVTSSAESAASSSSSKFTTDFNSEFADFMQVARREQGTNETTDIQEEVVRAELSGEWARPRIYICGACGSRHMTLKEMEDHKVATHQHVLCSHFELVGDQREHYQHLYLPGRDAPNEEARCSTSPTETACTKCAKICHDTAELHRHMLECGGDHAWLLGLTGSARKKCKWRPFGSRSRRRRQRGMKRSIQNSQNSSRVSTPKEKQQPAGPRVRPSDRESIQKMLANLPPKRATRKILQDNALRTQGRLRNVQTRTRPRMIGDNWSASRISRNKAALRNKLLKNAKSIQRNRCRSDNISAVIESVVRNYQENDKKKPDDDGESGETEGNRSKDAKEINESPSKASSDLADWTIRSKVVGRLKVLGKRRNVKTSPRLQNRSADKLAHFKAKNKPVKFKNVATSQTKDDVSGEEASSPKSTPKNTKTTTTAPKATDKDDNVTTDDKKTWTTSNKNNKLSAAPKKKRPVDPVASLNASIKAKSQLRTQDGKFARNPNSPAKSPDQRSASKDLNTLELATSDSGLRRTPRQLDPKARERSANDLKFEQEWHRLCARMEKKEKRLKAIRKSKAKYEEKQSKSTDWTETKPKLRAVQKSTKRADPLQPPRRVTRLSSDSDKMPTLEPAVQISSNEEYPEKSANDLPILSPVAASLQEQKSTSKEKESDMETDTETGKPAKEHKPRGRRPKEETKDTAKRKEVDATEGNESPRHNTKSPKERRGRRRKRSSSIENTITGDDKKEENETTIGKRDFKWKKKETRSNSKTKLEKDTVKNIPFEVKKKLLRSVSKDLNTLELATSDSGLRRTPRQLDPEARERTARHVKLAEEFDRYERIEMKKKRLKVIRMLTTRYANKKANDKTSLEKNVVNSAVTSKRTHQGRKRDGRIGAKTKRIAIDDVEGKIDSKQASSICPQFNARLSGAEPAAEVESDGKRNESSEKRRNKSFEKTACAMEGEQNPGETVAPAGKETKKGVEKTIEKIDKGNKVDKSVNKNDKTDKSDKIIKNDKVDKNDKGDKDDRIDKVSKDNDKVSKVGNKDDKISKEDKVDKNDKVIKDKKVSKENKVDKNNAVDMKKVDKNDLNDKVDMNDDKNNKVDLKDKIEKNVQVDKIDKNKDNNCDVYQDPAMNLSLSHLLETSNSVDSGKENSLETSVNVHKLKATRPRKGTRRERASRKRSLSNVIGILTEGMNIPVETQQSVVLTVQTSLDNDPDRLVRNGVAQQPTGESNVVAVDSFSELVLADGTSENEAVTANVTADHQRADERNDHPDPGKAQDDQNAFPSQKADVSPRVSKPRSPANDIILDLSRRKHKSKGGSFLEKIVSKIAKQKDALLVEGEVGTLLDSAADELTSILDEVVPPIIPENGASTPSQAKNAIDTTSTDVECATDLLKISDKPEERSTEETHHQSESPVKINSAADNEMNEELSDAINENSLIEQKPCENSPTLNEETSSEIPPADASTVISISLDATQKTSPEKVEERENDRWSGRKSSKRSSEGARLQKKGEPTKAVEEERTEENAKDIVARRPEEAPSFENELLPEKEDAKEVASTSKEVVEISCAHSESENKSVNDDPEPPNSEKNLADDYNESILVKSTDLPEVACEDTRKLTTNPEEETSVDKIASDNTNAPSGDSIDSLEKSVKSGISAQKKKSQINASEPSSKGTFKRKSQVALLPSIDIPQASVNDEAEEVSTSKSSTMKESLESLDEQSTKAGSTIGEDPAAKESSSPVETISKNPAREAQPNVDSSNPVNPSSPKTVKKKRGRKKKSLTNERVNLPDDEVASNGQPSVADPNELLVSLESFKVPKRGVKRKSEDDRWNGDGIPEEAPDVETDETEKSVVERKSSATNLGRSSSPDSLNGDRPSVRFSLRLRMNKKILYYEEYMGEMFYSTYPPWRNETDDNRETRRENEEAEVEASKNEKESHADPSSEEARPESRKKQQSSNEDLVDQAESTDDLSESDSRKKQKKKKRKKEEEDESADENAPIDSSVANSGGDKRKSKSLLDEHLDLSDTDDMDFPAVAQAPSESTKVSEESSNVEEESTVKSSSLPSESATNAVTSAVNDDDSSAILKPASDNYDSLEDPVTPKKRAAGNFVVVHTKTGEILIVEKRKKLTKEAARFFCDVCATSFTRKSSLKKHTQSQSHLSQVFKSTKVEPAIDSVLEETNNEWGNDQTCDQRTKSVLEDAQELAENRSPRPSGRFSLRLKMSKKIPDSVPYTYISKWRDETGDNREPSEDYPAYADSTSPFMDLRTTRQQSLEDELLDEEICKITENMSHDEYVLTDQLTPQPPEASSTPMKKSAPRKSEEQTRHGDKKRNKSKKKNLADEHLILDSPELDKSEETVPINEAARVPLSPSCELSTTKEVEAEKTVPEETPVESSDKNSVEKAEHSTCDVDTTKDEEHTELTTKSTLRRHSKVYSEGKEENQTVSSLDRPEKSVVKSKSSATNLGRSSSPDSLNGDRPSVRFSMRLKMLNKRIIYYDKYGMEICKEIWRNHDETDDNGGETEARREKEEAEEEASKNVLGEESRDEEHADPSSEDARPKPVKTGRKRGRPRLKDRVVIPRAATEPGINETNGVVVEERGEFEESKAKDQKLSSHTKEHQETCKPQRLDTNAQPVKSKRGRPRKNFAQINPPCPPSASMEADVSLPAKSDRDEAREMTKEVTSHSEITEETPPSLVDSSTANAETSVEDHRESNLSGTKEEDELNILKDQSAQETDAKTAEDEECQATGVPSEESDVVDRSSSDVECVSEGKPSHEETSENISINATDETPAELSSEITEKAQSDASQLPVAIDVLKSAESESAEIQADLSKSSEEKLSEEEFPEKEIREQAQKEEEEKELKLPSENSGDEAATCPDDKSLPVVDEPPPRETVDDDDEKIRPPVEDVPNKKISKLSTNKERESDRKRSKSSKGKSKRATVKVAELSSESENEDKIESASSNKSKIVKSVFGRVFGGEKADKVKEVLNDWVSRSEDDSDVSRSTSEARSCLRGSAKNEHRREKKRHAGSDAERSTKKKRNDSADAHGKSKNRRKRDPDAPPKDRLESLSPVNPIKRKRRESKIRADMRIERILRAFIIEESPVLSDVSDDANATKETQHESTDQFEDSRSSDKEAHDRTKERSLSSTDDWENLQSSGHESHGSSNCRKRRDSNARNERFESQFNVFKYQRRESKVDEAAWGTLDNNGASSCLFDERIVREMHESGDVGHPSSQKSVTRKEDTGEAWKNASVEDQARANGGRGKSRKDSSGRKDTGKISKTKTEEKATRSFDNDSLVALRDQETKDDTRDDYTARSTGESRNRLKNLAVVKNTGHEFLSYRDLASPKYTSQDRSGLDQQPKAKSKKSHANEDWRPTARNPVALDQEALIENERPSGKDIAQKKDAVSSRSGSSLAGEGPTMRDQTADGHSHMAQESDEKDDDDDDDDDDPGKRRMSPFYARDSPDSLMESSSNNEEEEDEKDEERTAHEDSCRKTNPSEFSGEKIVIRSPSSGHRSADVITIAPTDAIEDNALDVPREIESTAEPRQGKILNFDEELFVECCSRLKATSENELRGAKKIKLDHTESYHRRDDQQPGFRVSRDRWRDVESQNSLGSLLESVNQLLGEEMYSGHERSYRTRGSERSSRSASPDASRADNLGYEDSLDVAFEHNNKLRDKIQQRMRESENLIASTFGQRTNDDEQDRDDKRDNSNVHEHLPGSGASNRDQESSPGHKNKVNSTLGGLLDKALSNLLHNNGKHDHNGSAPMKLLAELACARAPTSTLPENDDAKTSGKNHQSAKMIAAAKDSDSPKKSTRDPAVVPKKARNPIKELFERKKEINDRKQQERSAALVELNSGAQRQRKPKKSKQQEFPLIRRDEHYGGLAEKKKRRESLERKAEPLVERVKDVYEFDEEESQMAPTLGSVMSYRSQVEKNYENNSWPRLKSVTGDLDAVLENGKAAVAGYVVDAKPNAGSAERKFRELEKFAPKTKGALKSFQSEEQQRVSISGPVDQFVERKQHLKRAVVPHNSANKQSKLKKRGKSSKKRTKNAWYENDSSDEFRTAAKAEDIGVGISKSQRACSKGKQNLFAELSTSSESEYESVGHEPPRAKPKKRESVDADQADWRERVVVEEEEEEDTAKKNQSESEMSDHSLVIDERKTTDEARNSDEDGDNQYERTFELDDLYREDSTDAESEAEEPKNTVDGNDFVSELIPLEEALDLLDRHENLDPKAEVVQTESAQLNGIIGTVMVEEEEASNDEVVREESKRLSPTDASDEKEDDDAPVLPEKLSSNEKPQKESDNLPLHVFLSRKVQESKKRKQQQLDKLREEQERILLDLQPTRRQRKCAIGKQGLLAEISSSDEESYARDSKKSSDRSEHESKLRKKRESKEKRKERYIEKKHEQMIAKEQKAIEEEILREVGKRKEIVLTQNSTDDVATEAEQKRKAKDRQKRIDERDAEGDAEEEHASQSPLDNSERAFSTVESVSENESGGCLVSPPKRKKHSPARSKKASRAENNAASPASKQKSAEKSKNRGATSGAKDSKERKSSNGKRDSDDEELKTTKSWNKVEEGVGVAIGRRKRTAALQLYYWSSSSDEEEPEPTAAPDEEEEDDRQEQHGWIVGDSHKRMITMLAMEKQLKEKRRRSEDELESGKAKSKKHRNSTS
ncbi:PREDICTED: microtubule-associated protein futsch-like [Dinoponera quadriceps]|uniref:Microtubule-associated protein futsch-like n=1 Tax=Dinoponera quadriceps TaxID=609295 RepID=A0A6P3X8N0_DINQU|nr:PREDICTED: microtubule-associated protein futsch-like [Dinoponera quadriceps]